MKTLKYINNVLLSLTLLSGVLGFINSGFWFISVVFLLMIGAFQGITGGVLFLLHPKSICFQLYVGGLIMFVITCYLPISNTWMILPIPLLMYFTFMIHTIHEETHEYPTYKTS